MNSQPTAIIVGHQGQDGTLLSAHLAHKGYRIIGIGRTETVGDGISCYCNIDIENPQAVLQLVEKVGTCEIYYLAACHSSSEKPAGAFSLAELFFRSQAIHVTGLVNFLSAMTRVSPRSRLFYAASSLIYNSKNSHIQDETTPFAPIGIYGITKAQGVWVCREYRKKHNLFVSCGILYNHESHLRPRSFLTAKVIRAAIDIANGFQKHLEIGNLSAMVDWGYAPDLVKAFHAVLALKSPEDFIFATGDTHSVEELLEAVFTYFSLDWRDHVRVNENLLERAHFAKQGDPSRLHARTGISLTRPFEEFINRLIQDHINSHNPTNRRFHC